MKNQNRVTIIGAGSWGLALASVLADNGREVLLWTIEQDVIQEFENAHTCQKYAKGKAFSPSIRLTGNLEEAIGFSSYLLICIPVKVIHQVLPQIDAVAKEPKVFIIASKGLYQGKPVSHLIKKSMSKRNLEGIVALSGPSFAVVTLHKGITAVVSASKSRRLAKEVQLLFSGSYFRVYTSRDIEGVEYAAALKNVLAIAAGLIDGAGHGQNARAALIARGINEILRLKKISNIKRDTLMGLAGIGDIVLTCTDQASRNYRFGYFLGQGKSAEEAYHLITTTVEGTNTLEEVYQLAQKYNLEMPIVQGLYNVIYLHKPIADELKKLMQRELKDEFPLE